MSTIKLFCFAKHIHNSPPPVICLKSVSQRDTAVSSQKRPKSVLDTDNPYQVACLLCASCPLYVTLHIVSSRQLVILPIPKCVLHATQYAFVALWLLARIPGNVLAHSLSVLAFLVRYPIRHVHNNQVQSIGRERERHFIYCRCLQTVTLAIGYYNRQRVV